MPIFIPNTGIEQPEPALPAFASKEGEKCGDFAVDLATDPNPKGHYHGKQADRAAVCELPATIDQASVKDLMESLTAHAIEATKQQAEKISSYRSGSTWNLAAFDPRNEQLHLATIGDSPAFVVMSDGTHPPALLRISNATDSVAGFGLQNYIGRKPRDNNSSTPHPPVLHTEKEMNFTAFDGDIEKLAELTNKDKLASAADGYIPLSQLRAEAERQGFNPATLSLTLVAGSDGIINLSPEELSEAAIAPAKNKAKAILEKALEKGSGDNLTAVVLPLVKDGKKIGTHPIMSCVCDGFKDHGHIIADTAIGTFQQSMEKLLDTGHKKASTEPKKEAAPDILLHDLRTAVARHFDREKTGIQTAIKNVIPIGDIAYFVQMHSEDAIEKVEPFIRKLVGDDTHAPYTKFNTKGAHGFCIDKGLLDRALHPDKAPKLPYRLRDVALSKDASRNGAAKSESHAEQVISPSKKLSDDIQIKLSERYQGASLLAIRPSGDERYLTISAPSGFPDILYHDLVQWGFSRAVFPDGPLPTKQFIEKPAAPEKLIFPSITVDLHEFAKVLGMGHGQSASSARPANSR